MGLILAFLILAFCSLGFGITALIYLGHKRSRWLRNVAGVCALFALAILLFFTQMKQMISMV